MSSNPPVSVFNANTLQVTVQVNNGQSYTIAGAQASSSYAPVLGSGGTTFNFNGPSANSLGPGSNSVEITPSNSTTPIIFSVDVPTNVQIISLQLYVFWASVFTAGWVLLNNGQLIGQNTVSVGSSSPGSGSSAAAAKRR